MKHLTRTTSLLAVALAGLALTASPARAVILAENTTPSPGGILGTHAVGQSFTVTGSGSFTNIRFNFFHADTLTPYAWSTALLFTSAFTGHPSLLSSAPGFLGSAGASVDGFYNFGPGVTLTAGTQYFLYTDNPLSGILARNGNVYAGGDIYLSDFTRYPDIANYSLYHPADALFRVTGDAVGAPDGGSTALLLALSLAGLCRGRRSRRA